MRWMAALLLLSIVGTVAPAQQATVPDSVLRELQKLDGMFSFLRQRNVRDYAITTPRGIDEGRYVNVGGIEQWITIRGEDRANPVILFLHGGPGDATNPWGHVAFRSWLRHFTVVQWDQRGSGRTLGRNGPPASLTIDLMAGDGVALAESLRKDLNQDKLIIVGHSWGSILGIHMVRARPDLFHAFVGTGQVADPARNYEVAYSELLAAVERQGNANAVRELREIGKPPWKDGRGFGVQRKWANQLETADVFLTSTIGLALTAPGSSPRDVNDWFDGQIVSGRYLVPQTSVLAADVLRGAFSLPFFVVQGATDYTTPTSLAREQLRSIRAPRKGFVEIPGAGHFAVFMKSDEFLRHLVTLVLPIVKQAK